MPNAFSNVKLRVLGPSQPAELQLVSFDNNAYCPRSWTHEQVARRTFKRTYSWGGKSAMCARGCRAMFVSGLVRCSVRRLNVPGNACSNTLSREKCYDMPLQYWCESWPLPVGRTVRCCLRARAARDAKIENDMSVDAATCRPPCHNTNRTLHFLGLACNRSFEQCTSIGNDDRAVSVRSNDYVECPIGRCRVQWMKLSGTAVVRRAIDSSRLHRSLLTEYRDGVNDLAATLHT